MMSITIEKTGYKTDPVVGRKNLAVNQLPESLRNEKHRYGLIIFFPPSITYPQWFTPRQVEWKILY